MAWFNLFRNNDKEEGDRKPLYSNNKIILEEDVIFKAGTTVQVALWKKTETASGKQVDMVSIKIDENDYVGEEKKEDENIPF
jgi:hypothetical protein